MSVRSLSTSTGLANALHRSADTSPDEPDKTIVGIPAIVGAAVRNAPGTRAHLPSPAVTTARPSFTLTTLPIMLI
jgi:hypothetical protein